MDDKEMLLIQIENSIKGLSKDEIEKVIDYLSTLKAQHTQ